jgi:hypothetical protein
VIGRKPVRIATSLACAALAPVAAAAAPAESTIVYPLRPGDTLFDLASHYFLRADDYRAVQRLNAIRAPRRLPVGFKLKVPVALLRTEPIKAQVADVSGEANLVVGGRAARIEKGLVVGEGAEILTGANAFVRFALPDGSYVTLPSQSRFEVQTLRRTPFTGAIDREFNLLAGRSESVVTPMTRPRDRFIIKTPQSVAAVRGTIFRVDFDPQTGRSTTEVVEGTVGVSSTVNGSTAVVTKAFGDHASSTGVEAPRALLSPPRLEEPARTQDGEDIALKVIPIPEAQLYRARLARDAGMLDPIAETQSDTPQLTFHGLANGAWFVQLTALDADGLEGLPTVYGFERVLHTLELGSPTPVVQGVKSGWLFRWISQGDGEHQYRFQLASGADLATPILDEPGLTTPQMTVTGLPDGVYWWRVRSTLLIDGKRWEKWSDVHPFRIGR